jgi:hypothetical protein
MKNLQINNLNRGQAMMTSVIFFLIISLTVIFGIANPLLKQVHGGVERFKSSQSYFLAEAAVEDVIYRLNTAKPYTSTQTLNLNGESATVTTTSTATGKLISANSSINNNVRKVQTYVILGTGVSFHYGVQAGQGGFVLNNSSSITGNVHSSGQVIGTTGNIIRGDVVSAGASGLVYGVHATGTVFSHSIGGASQATIIDKNAYYYQNITNTTVNGTSFPNSSDQPLAELPISDAQLDEWESDALAGGVMASSECDIYAASSNTCTITSSKTLGPKKIPFNLLIKSTTGVLTVAGPLWVVGNLTTQTGPTIRMEPSLGSQNVAVIADNPANSTGSGIIDIGQTTIFEGSGAPGSFVFMISRNNSSEQGGSVDAINMGQGASALVAYASHGQITLSQSVSVKEVTAYKIILTQSANVTYDTGLPSTLFSTGPGGGWEITGWKEVK